MSNPELTPTELAYAAGIVDGEGCISLDNNWNRGFSYSAAVRVSNTSPVLIWWLHEKFGGFRQLRLDERGKGNRKPCFTWGTKSNKAAAFLRLVRPYLLFKGDQADAAIRLQEINSGKRAYSQSLEARAEVEALLETVAASRKGV